MLIFVFFNKHRLPICNEYQFPIGPFGVYQFPIMKIWLDTGGDIVADRKYRNEPAANGDGREWYGNGEISRFHATLPQGTS